MSPVDVHFWSGIMLAVIIGVAVAWAVYMGVWTWMEYWDWRDGRRRKK